jgi:hypothetical protein
MSMSARASPEAWVDLRSGADRGRVINEHGETTGQANAVGEKEKNRKETARVAMDDAAHGAA